MSSAASSRIHAGLSSKWMLKGFISRANQWPRADWLIRGTNQSSRECADRL
ncbi:protein of unknown function (plasmid) [Cupriavidus taiwanensis]|uniref:Uncharacterized protein n=1 Tax=Cupriavidus taiwanensis TaxID=164546 RepID=A0A9Q7XVA9_9BURK|nr:protein of unknown function [Cupriavidus taiwanensis]